MKTRIIIAICLVLAIGAVVLLYRMREPPQPVVSAEKKSVTVRGQEVWYREGGTGTPILILPGWGGPTDRYFAIQDELAEKGYRVFLPDLPGLPGKTSPAFIPLAEWDSWIEEFGDAAIEEEFVILSHSLSAQIALQYVSKKPSRSRGAILVGPWLASSPFQQTLWGGVARAVRFLSPIVYREMTWVENDKAWATAVALISVVEEQPEVPCLVLWGKRDVVRHLLTGWNTIRCEARQYDWDHSPQIRATEKLAAVIDEFIRTTRPPFPR